MLSEERVDVLRGFLSGNVIRKKTSKGNINKTRKHKKLQRYAAKAKISGEVCKRLLAGAACFVSFASQMTHRLHVIPTVRKRPYGIPDSR